MVQLLRVLETEVDAIIIPFTDGKIEAQREHSHKARKWVCIVQLQKLFSSATCQGLLPVRSKPLLHL